MPKTIGESVHNLPIDENQDISPSDIALLKEMMKSSKKTPVKIKDITHKNDSDSDSENDSDDDADSDTSEIDVIQKDHGKSVWAEIKSTFIASILFVLLNTTMVDNAIKNIGMDGFKLMCIKLFLFAIIFFILRYKFL